MNRSRADDLRRAHPTFSYESFAWEQRDDALRMRFDFRVEPDIRFAPQTAIASVRPEAIDRLGPEAVDNLVFHLGLIEMLSYWKAACSPLIDVRAAALEAAQIAWLGDLLRHGMGEFFYVNGIDFTRPDFVRIRSSAERALPAARRGTPGGPALVLVSGGKDSAVSLQLLRQSGLDFGCLLLNPTPAAEALARAAGCIAPVRVQRTIDRRLLELNEAGYLNGHTPFSAFLATLGVTVAALVGYGTVIASNERSCDEAYATFLGAGVNHQYSKSSRFEAVFRDYASTYLAPGIDYFSLLRPLYEVQIARIFSRYPEYFAAFRSCNRGQRDNSWCRRCPKCLFIYAALYPFLEPEELAGIFGEDLFGGTELIPLTAQLLGLGEHRPFECVGTVAETLAVLHLAVARARARGGALPPLLEYVEREVLCRRSDLDQLTAQVLGGWGEQHHLPAPYVALLRRALPAGA